MRGQMIFTNGRLVFPDRVVEGLSLRVAAGKIAEICEGIAPARDEEVLEAMEAGGAPLENAVSAFGAGARIRRCAPLSSRPHPRKAALRLMVERARVPGTRHTQ